MRDERERIKTILQKNYLTHTWLINELEKENISVAGNELSEILSGKRKGDKAVKVINCSLNIVNSYEEKFVNNR